MKIVSDTASSDRSAPLGASEALALADLPAAQLPDLMARARARRDGAWGSVVTYSPKVFLPLTNLCRNRCDYCSFRRSPGDAGEWTMSPDEVVRSLRSARAAGCVEALFCLGDRADGWKSYRDLLQSWGHEDTVAYLRWAAEAALAEGLLPHTNAGILSREDMAVLRPVNVSLGLMLESVSERLCERGGPHHGAPDKRPAVRIGMTREAGTLRVPFTSGVLLGIGETARERVQTLLEIRRLHAEHGHIQEVIVQNFRAGPLTPMASSPEPEAPEVLHAVCMARLILPDDVSVQAPPNLNPGATAALLSAGLNDFGGVSPITPDFINPGHAWPHLERLEREVAQAGFTLRPRLPVYDRYCSTAWLDDRLQGPVGAARARLVQPLAEAAP